MFEDFFLVGEGEKQTCCVLCYTTIYHQKHQKKMKIVLRDLSVTVISDSKIIQNFLTFHCNEFLPRSTKFCFYLIQIQEKKGVFKFVMWLSHKIECRDKISISIKCDGFLFFPFFFLIFVLFMKETSLIKFSIS